jgi:metal-responsive CopG/Arc/MetJ family transcriptional regulator
MKTAISIPDDLFRSAEEVAESMGVSRSELYAEAVRRFLGERRAAEVTERLNEVYEHAPGGLDPVIDALQFKSMAKLEW